MFTVYKFEIVVADYEDKGRQAIKQALLCNRDTYGIVTNIEEKSMEFFNDLAVKELFSWQPITTAPRDGSHFVLYYAREQRQYVVYFDTLYEQMESGGFEFVESYFVVDSPANHTNRYIIEEQKLTNSYWQPLQIPPTL